MKQRTSPTCTLCDLNDDGDEFHYIFKCTFFNKERVKYLKPYFRRRPNTLKMEQLFNVTDKTQLVNLAKFVRIIISSFK